MLYPYRHQTDIKPRSNNQEQTHLDMRISTSLACASPATRKPGVFKRRKLNHVLDSGFHLGRALTDNSNVASTSNEISPCTRLSCSTCYRVLSTTIRPGVAGPLTCSRCTAPTCAICARTCTSYTRPSSFPPTPALTRSPSPTTAPASPKRIALGLSYATMNGGVSLSATKRKKAPTDKEDADFDPDGGEMSLECHHDTTPAHGAIHECLESIVPGCGRVVCRSCCVESVPNDGKLCVDCFALV